MITTHEFPRDDAVTIGSGIEKRRYVPTSDATKWVGNWGEFIAAGGVCHFNEDQTEIILTLPVPYKFGIGFGRDGAM